MHALERVYAIYNQKRSNVNPRETTIIFYISNIRKIIHETDKKEFPGACKSNAFPKREINNGRTTQNKECLQIKDLSSFNSTLKWLWSVEVQGKFRHFFLPSLGCWIGIYTAPRHISYWILNFQCKLPLVLKNEDAQEYAFE